VHHRLNTEIPNLRQFLLNEAAARQLGLRPKPRDFALDANPEG
jgi:hypothetical protein